MKPKRLINFLSEFIDWALRAEIALHANPTKSLEFRNNDGAYVNRVTWCTANSGLLYLNNLACVDEYVKLVELQQYTIILYDGALLQISYDFCSKGIVGHRLCYYPWPFIECDKELLASTPLVDVVQEYTIANYPVRLSSPIRFEYDPSRANDEHPAVHMTFNASDVRIAVSRPLGIGQFLSFVFKHSYSDLWDNHEYLRLMSPYSFDFDCLLREHQTKYIHVICP